MVKIYRSINYYKFSVAIKIKGHVKFIEFKHGSSFPVLKNGFFATENTDEQEAIEKDALYGKEFILEKYEQPEAKDIKDAPYELIPTTEVKNVQEAKEWLVKNKKEKLSDIPNKMIVTQKANKYNVVFECFQ